MRLPAKKGTGKSPYLNNSPLLDELSQLYGVVACLFFGYQLNTCFPTLCNGRERSTPTDVSDDDDDNEEDEEEEEEEEEELEHLFLGSGLVRRWHRWGASVL